MATILKKNNSRIEMKNNMFTFLYARRIQMENRFLESEIFNINKYVILSIFDVY